MTINIYNVYYYRQNLTKCVFKSTKTMEKRQSPVEWLITELQKNSFIGTYCEKDEIESRQKLFDSIIQTAISLEKLTLTTHNLENRIINVDI